MTTKIDDQNSSTKKRGEYATKKKKELENLLSAAKHFKFSQKTEKSLSKKNPASIAEFTKDTCLYPNKYLDNDNTCITCSIYEYCGCNLKNLGKKRKQHE